MVKLYLKYSFKKAFGVIASASCNIVSDFMNKYVFSGTLESITKWDIRRGIQISNYSLMYDGKKSAVVSRICLSPDRLHLAAGYSNGVVRIWNLKTGEIKNVFDGHKSSITALAYERNGHFLVSGSMDTNIIIWNVIDESGSFKLRGHKDSITNLKFLETNDSVLLIVSSSKDCLLKIWDFQNQCCIQTLVGHRESIWSFDINLAQNRLVTLSEKILRIYKIECKSPSADFDEMYPEILFYGAIELKKSSGVGKLVEFNSDGSILAVQSGSKIIEFFKFNSNEAINRKKHRLKKKKSKLSKKYARLLAEYEEKLANGCTDLEPPVKPTLDDTDTNITVFDEFTSFCKMNTKNKVKSFSFLNCRTNQFFVSFMDNSIEHYKILPSVDAESHNEDDIISEQLGSINMRGHRSPVLNLILSSDNQILISSSKDQIKVWNMESYNCIRTMDLSCSCFTLAPGERYLLIGTYLGKIGICDFYSTEMVNFLDSHDGAVNSLQVHCDMTHFFSVSNDETLKFWRFKVDQVEGNSQRLGFELERTINFSDRVLCCKVSKDGKYVAVALMDYTIHVLSVEKFATFHILYGHKLPVLCMDISDDGYFILTGSADKNIRLWGMDFGDCHKSIYAHEDYITRVGFVSRSHFFFTLAKDGYLKYWDADKFQMIQSIAAHQKEAWALAISDDGEFIISGSNDYSIRIWERTKEQTSILLEQEKILEDQWEMAIENEDRHFVEDEKANVEVSRINKKTLDSVKSAEILIEALEIIAVEEENQLQYETEYKRLISIGEREKASQIPKPPSSDYIKNNQTHSEYLFEVLKKIRSSELEQSILTLPFAMVLKLIDFIDIWISSGQQLEICSKVLFLIIQAYQNQISSSRISKKSLYSIQKNMRIRLQLLKDIIGLNQVTMNYLKRNIETNDNSKFFQAINTEFQKNLKKKKITYEYWK